MANNKQTDSNSIVLVKQDNKVNKPNNYNVVLLNDDFTPMEFVIDILIKFFHKNQKQAHKIMMEVHEMNKGVAGVYTKEIAQAKKQQVIGTARANEFPLNCIIEQSSK